MKIKLILTTISLLASNTLLAQYTGPGSSSEYKSVNDVLNNPIDNSKVVLEGYIINQINAEEYTFSNGKDQIVIEIDRNKFQSSVDEKTKVRISGEVDKNFMKSPQIDVDILEIVK